MCCGEEGLGNRVLTPRLRGLGATRAQCYAFGNSQLLLYLLRCADCGEGIVF